VAVDYGSVGWGDGMRCAMSIPLSAPMKRNKLYVDLLICQDMLYRCTLQICGDPSPHCERVCEVKNTLYWGDNLNILRERDGDKKMLFPDECIDLIYLDPPFNSQQSHNLLFKDQHGVQAPSQIHAFGDTWKWANAFDTYHKTINDDNQPFVVRRTLRALFDILRESEMMAYLAMMTPRLTEMHRVLKPTGSLYLHCDPSASHYLRILLDVIFGPENFRNELIWKRTSAHSSAKRYGPVHDTLLFYSKSDVFVWNPQYQPHEESYLASHYRGVDAHGRRFTLSDLTAMGVRSGSSGQPWRGFEPAKKGNHWKFSLDNLEKLDMEGRIHWPQRGGWPRYCRYLDEMKGVALQDTWTDISPINAKAAERLGYPTQKPLALLKRIIEASSNPGDVILDPFCGCGTSVDAAQELGRSWRGIDMTNLAINVIQHRLAGRYGLLPGIDYDLYGVPEDIDGARRLADVSKDQFELWALKLIGALPWEDHQKKGADKGRDGVLVWRDTEVHEPRHAVVSVKGGINVHADAVRDLIGTMHTESAEMGILLTLKKPTKAMLEAAAGAGMYTPKFSQEQVRRVQIICVEDLLAETARVHLPQGSLVISQKLPKRVADAPPMQREIPLLAKLPRNVDDSHAVAGAALSGTRERMDR